jgi:serine/threonine protein phosphatase PrpC
MNMTTEKFEISIKDQSLVQKMLDAGLLSPEEAARHPYRNVILQALGVKQEINVALTALTLCRDDCLLLCSDGLSNAVTPAEMRRIVNEADSPAYACHWLIEMANARGGDDNITAIVAHFTGAGQKRRPRDYRQSRLAGAGGLVRHQLASRYDVEFQ